jgi:protein SCO1/2
MSMHLRRFIVPGGLLVLFVAGVVLWQMGHSHAFSGVVQSPPAPAPNISLTDDRGALFRLSDLRGQWVLLAYGYTHCPDICPLTLSNLKAAKQLLGVESSKIRVVFASVDPERDTVPVMHAYVGHFGPDFVGLTGSPAEVAAAARPYAVRYEKVQTTSAGGYAMAHSAYIYLIDPQQQWRMTYAFGVKPEEFASDLSYLIAASGPH